VLAVVGINVSGQKAFNWPGKLPFETVDENSFEDAAFK